MGIIPSSKALYNEIKNIWHLCNNSLYASCITQLLIQFSNFKDEHFVDVKNVKNCVWQYYTQYRVFHNEAELFFVLFHHAQSNNFQPPQNFKPL